MTNQFTELINSIIADCFRKDRSKGNFELSNKQVVYLGARVAEFYERNNDLVTNFRMKLQSTWFPQFFSRNQIFLLLKTMANDLTILNGPRGLNDIQFFAGGDTGCKYDPFLPGNRINMSQIGQVTKIGTVDLDILC